MAQKRYAQLLELVADTRPSTIIEIGVWNGRRAIAMSEVALQHSERVHYHGFDLFEEATAQTDREEFNAKRHNTLHAVHAKIDEFRRLNPGFSFDLTRGNTRETLAGKSLVADFVYIDGGHSVETIRSDYEAVRGSRVVVFDDYYLPDEQGQVPDLETLGANAVVDPLGAEIVRSGDRVMGGGEIALAVLRAA